MSPLRQAGCCWIIPCRPPWTADVKRALGKSAAFYGWHGCTPRPEADIRALAKAVESGDGAVERLCRSWHRQWAARLRCGEALPGGLAPYLSQALDLLEQRRLQA